MIWYVVRSEKVSRCFSDAGQALQYQLRLAQTFGVLSTLSVEVG